MRRRNADERRRRDTGGWGLLVRLFSTGERGLPARTVIVCTSLPSARLFSTSGRSLLFMARRYRGADGWRRRNTSGALTLTVCTHILTARLFSTSGRSRFFKAGRLLQLLLSGQAC